MRPVLLLRLSCAGCGAHFEVNSTPPSDEQLGEARIAEGLRQACRVVVAAVECKCTTEETRPQVPSLILVPGGQVN